MLRFEGVSPVYIYPSMPVLWLDFFFLIINTINQAFINLKRVNTHIRYADPSNRPYAYSEHNQLVTRIALREPLA